jgi:hypothetical protein
MVQDLMKRNYKYIIVAVIIFIIALYFYQKDDVKVSNVNWTYNDGSCFVSFKIKNNSHYDLSRNVRITAHFQRNIGKGAVVNDIVGEKIITFNLAPRADIEFKETLELNINRRPDIVSVSQWSPK